MKISASFTKDRYIENFALLGEIEGGIEVSTADDVTEAELMENYPSFKLQADGKTVALDKEKLKEFQKAKLLTQQQSKQNENNGLLATYLKDHPIQWKDGKYYDGNQLRLNADMRNLETGIYFNRGRSAGNKYSFMYEADDDYPELSVRQHTPTYNKIFRLCSNADHMWIQSDGSLYRKLITSCN